jgi:hypothetical protein
MRSTTSSGFIRPLSVVVIVVVSMMLITCDDTGKKNSNNQLLPLLLISSKPTMLMLYNAGTPDGNLGGRTGADAICNASGNMPAGVKKVHAFISMSASDQISDMPANYGYQANLAIYGPDGTSMIANNWADMLDGSIAMSLDAAGILPAASTWLNGTNGSGNWAGLVSSCQSFVSNNGSDFSFVGLSNNTDSTWMTAGSVTCSDTTHYLLCIGEK